MSQAEEMPNVSLFFIFILYFGEKGLRDIEEKNLYYINKSCTAS